MATLPTIAPGPMTPIPAGTPGGAPVPVISPGGASATTKPLSQMTVAEATASGQLDAYNKLVASYPGQKAPQPGSTLAGLTTVPNSSSTTPSSSATAVQGLNGQTAVTGTTTAPVTTTDNTASTLASAYSSQGVNISASDVQKWIDAGYDPKEAAAQAAQYYQSNQERQTQLQTQQQTYQADLAKNNADYAAASAKLNFERTAAVHAGVAQAAKSGMFENQSSDQVAYGNAIGRTYDNLQVQLDQAAASAKAASDSGNYKAVAAINASMDSLLQQGLASIRSNQLTEQQQKQTQKSLEQTTQAKATTAFQNALIKPSITPANASILSSLPSNWNDMTAAQQQQAANITNGLMSPGGLAAQTGDYNNPTTGQFDPSLAWSSVQGGLTNSIAQQARDTAVQRAQIALLTAQTNAAQKELITNSAVSLATTPQGQGFLDGYQTAGIHNKDKNGDTLQSIESKVTSGNIKSAQEEIVNAALSTGSATDVRMYNTLQGLPSIMDTITAAIRKLPADQQPGLINGTWQNIAAKFGQNPDPALRTLAAEMGHVQKNYITGVYGMRAASLQNDSIFNNLFPAGTDAASLSFSVAAGLVNTARDTINSQVKARLGTSAYSTIFNGGDATGVFTKSGQPFNYSSALSSGYSDSDIQAYLSSH